VDEIKIATQTQSSLTFAYKYVANGIIQVAFFIVTPTRFVLVFLAHFWTFDCIPILALLIPQQRISLALDCDCQLFKLCLFDVIQVSSVLISAIFSL